MRQYMLYKNTLNLYNTFILYIFKIIYNFKIKFSINRNLGNTCTVRISEIKKLTTDNTSKAGINYKEQI